MSRISKAENRYKILIESIFFHYWKEDIEAFEFLRTDIEDFAKKLDIPLPKNLGDVIYSFRFRVSLPAKILATQPNGSEWIIEGAGKARYRFRLTKETRITPNQNLASILIPDSTPELIRKYSLDDEQALLAIVRYNRLIDTFLSLTTYSLQNHLRTTVAGIGQIEIDELYIGLDRHGCHYIVPVQAKGGRDQIGVVQISQDIAFSEEKFPGTRCRPIAAQFMSDGSIALFELKVINSEVKVVEERHYLLVPHDQLSANETHDYK